MFGSNTDIDLTEPQIRTLKRRYRLTHLSDQNAIQKIWDRLVRDKNYHVKHLPANRTEK